jgi:DNA helicase-2/ATP-dependent DNA helicase PcrA
MNETIRGGVPVNAQQAAVIDDLLAQGPGRRVTVVGAGAGSGKTYTTVAAVLRLIEDRGASVEQFILITFTRQAADKLRADLEEGLRKRQVKAADPTEGRRWAGQRERLSGAYVGTIHGFCRMVLGTYGYQERIARSADVTLSGSLLHDAILDAAEEACRADSPLLGDEAGWDEHRLRGLVRDILSQAAGLGLDTGAIRDATDRQPEDAGKPYRVALARLVARVTELYAARKAEAQVLDANDLLRLTASLLEGPHRIEIVRKIAARYRYLFIDEFQDTDRTQKRIADAFLGHLAGVLVVGDIKQSLYGWRSADVSLLGDVAHENGVTVLSLSVSRRPTRPLLAAQNALFGRIADNYPELGEPLQPWEETLEPQSGLPPMTFVRGGKDTRPPSGIEATADQVRWWLEQQIDDPRSRELRPVAPGDIAVLFRSNWVLRAYEEGLALLLPPGVRARREGGGQFYARPEAAATYRVLRLLLDYPDDAVLVAALESPYFASVNSTAEEQRLLQYGKQRGNPLTDWFEREHPRLAEALAELRALVRTATVPQILGRLYELFGAREAYLARGDRQAAENLEKLRELARSLFRAEQALTLRQYVGLLRRNILAGAPEPDAPTGDEPAGERVPYVRLMTVHAAKGLEFPLVIIPEVQAPLIRPELDPDFLLTADGLDVDLSEAGLQTRSANFAAILAQSRPGRLKEEMRVFYVAVTRAQHAVAFVGGGKPRRPLEPTARDYSWADELRRAWAALGNLAVVR